MLQQFFILTTSALVLLACVDKSTGAGDVKPAPPCPEVGHAISLCPDLQVKLLAARFHRAIGKGSVISAPVGHVFCLVELEWPKLPEGQEREVPVLVDGSGKSWPPHPAAEKAWRAMQPDAPDSAVRPPVVAGDREILIFDLAASAASQGLQLRFAAPCEEPLESTYFCLGRHQIVME